MSGIALDKLLNTRLQQRQAQFLYRQRKIVQGVADRQSYQLANRTLINFCSNDYLGLAHHPKVIKAFQDAVNQYGVGSGAAHLISGHSIEHHALEEALAEYVGYPRALLFSTGYMANQGVINALLDRSDAIFGDRLNHASLIDAALLSKAPLYRYKHNDLSDLARQVVRSDARYRMIVTDAVFSMDGDLASISQLAEYAKKTHSWLMIDDAHGLGVLAKGQGSLVYWQVSAQDVPIYMATLGKALGVFGAFVAGSEALIETLIQDARSYIYTTALPPAIAAALRCSLQIVQQEQDRHTHLQTLIDYFCRAAKQLELPVMPSLTPIQPILIGDSAKTTMISEQLLQKGLWVSAIRPPTVPKNTARLRITLSATHTIEQIDYLLDCLQQVIVA